MLKSGVGTCIEQAKMIKFFFDRKGIKNKVYCHRSYETEENYDKEVKMHCFVLFYYDNSWYHFEHSNIYDLWIMIYDLQFGHKGTTKKRDTQEKKKKNHRGAKEKKAKLFAYVKKK